MCDGFHASESRHQRSQYEMPSVKMISDLVAKLAVIQIGVLAHRGSACARRVGYLKSSAFSL